MDIQNLLHQFLSWVSLQDTWVLWLFFTFSNFFENVFPPWPGDTATVFSGFLMAQGGVGWSWVLVWSSTMTGNLLGAFTMYKLGSRVLRWLRAQSSFLSRLLADEESLEKTLDWFSKYGAWVVVFSRFSAGIRFFVSIVAGMAKMGVLPFLVFFSIATILWNGLLIYGGYYLGKNWGQVADFLNGYNRIVTLVFILIIAWFLQHRLREHRRKSSGT